MTTAGKPGRKCSICIHKHRAAIDAALLAGHAQHAIAAEHGLSRDALSRHGLRHVSHAVADSPAGDPVAVAALRPGDIDLLADVLGLRSRLLKLLGRAERDRDIRGGLLAIREAIRLVETVGRLTGQIDASGVKVAVQVNAASARGVVALRERIAAKLAVLAGPETGFPTIESHATD